jgi:hypothetical protein
MYVSGNDAISVESMVGILMLEKNGIFHAGQMEKNLLFYYSIELVEQLVATAGDIEDEPL